MTTPSSKVQQALSGALLHMLQSSDLSPEDAEWVQQFAVRTIAEFNFVQDKKEAADEPIAA